jgi:NhaP-type Na+/H+ or K+/H+ antiporter
VVDLIVLACIVFAFGIVSRRLEGTILTAPIVFVLCGAILGPAGLGLVEMGLDDHTVLLLGEIALTLVLFADAARTGLSVLRKNGALPMRLLGIGMPLTIALGTATAALLFADLTVWEAAIIGTVLAPTDAALGQAVVRIRLAWVSVLFAGWFGPRGLASIVLGLIVVAEAPQLAGRDEIETVVASTVLLSVLLYGITATPLSAAYARRVEGMAVDSPEKQGAAEVSTCPSSASIRAQGSQ